MWCIKRREVKGVIGIKWVVIDNFSWFEENFYLYVRGERLCFGGL